MALAFIKEMDLIATKRQDALGTKPERPANAGGAGPSAPKPKAKSKGGGRGKASAQQEEEEESSQLAQGIMMPVRYPKRLQR